jgi:DNA-binding response OmpR family regulator
MVAQTGSAILVVEDESHIRDLMVGELVAQGHACVAVTGLAEAGAQLCNRAFRLIILDLVLRDGSGLDLLRTIQDTPVLVVSGSSVAMLREAAAVGSVRAVLTKPFSLPELRQKVTDCLSPSAESRGAVAAQPLNGPVESVGTVTHALKNLLAIAIGEVEFLLSEEAERDPVLRREGLESIRRVVLNSRQLLWNLDRLAGVSAPASKSR